MISVALCALGGSGDDEARALAADLGGVVYETRLKLAQPPPVVVLRTSDAAAAQNLVEKLRARGHDAIAVDEEAVAPPFVVRAFRLGDTSFDCDDVIGSAEGGTMQTTMRLAYGDVLALVRAALVHRTESVEKVTERKMRPGMAIATGGLIMSKKVTREEKHVTHDREDLLYVFRAGGGAPWLVAEHEAVYASLENVARTQRENFQRVATELRARCLAATWDERLLAVRNVDDRRDLDLRAQMLAISIARKLTYR